MSTGIGVELTTGTVKLMAWELGGIRNKCYSWYCSGERVVVVVVSVLSRIKRDVELSGRVIYTWSTSWRSCQFVHKRISGYSGKVPSTDNFGSEVAGRCEEKGVEDIGPAR